MNQKGVTTVVILLTLFFVIIGGTVIYKTQQAKISLQTSSPKIVATPKNAGLRNTTEPSIIKEITLKPKNTKQVIFSAPCYLSDEGTDDASFAGKDGELMSIIAETSTNNQETNQAIYAFNLLLNNSITYNQSLDPIALGYKGACLGHGVRRIIKEINNLNYLGMDKVKGVLALFAQDIYGSPEVQVYAKKGNNYVLLNSGMLLSGDRQNQLIENCKFKFKDLDESVDCFHKDLLEDSDLEKKAVITAQNLIKLFAIQ